jgi:ABC-type multidrug transport system ATPase subunit
MRSCRGVKTRADKNIGTRGAQTLAISARLRGVLAVRGLYKRLGGKRVLEGVELELGGGETAVVLGPNGSGKSTLLRVLCGYLDADRGDVIVAGHALGRQPARAKSELGYLPDGLEAPPDLRVSELVQLVRALKALPARVPDGEATWQRRLGLGEVWAERLRALSFGQRKRVALACALSGDPALLLLDEPSNGLDPAAVDLVIELLAERRRAGKSQLLASNDLTFAERVGGTGYRLTAGRLEPVSLARARS